MTLLPYSKITTNIVRPRNFVWHKGSLEKLETNLNNRMDRII
uniref:Uncharacterized protein n=1 Tax=Meloidogyne enterolobii TaxID=390850 RepID=A0A6V7VFU4_MELEN|nr:unnamed protein product [Meloidogyne enterolobii]